MVLPILLTLTATVTVAELVPLASGVVVDADDVVVVVVPRSFGDS